MNEFRTVQIPLVRQQSVNFNVKRREFVEWLKCSQVYLRNLAIQILFCIADSSVDNREKLKDMQV